MSEEDTEQWQRRRSARIIALEEKKEEEKKAMAAARKNNPENINNDNQRGKGKVVVEDDFDCSDHSDDEDDDDEQYTPTKKRGRKSKPLHRLISSIQPMQGGRNPENRHSSRRNGMNCDANSTDAALGKRHTYLPPSGNSLFSEVMNGPKLNLQFTKPSIYYQDSLVRFVQDMGPVAQRSAAKKLESLRFNQILCGETPKPNPLANFLDTIENTTTTLEPTSQQQSPDSPPLPATQPDYDAPNAMHSSLLSNRPLTIPGFTPPAPRETRNVSNFDSNTGSGDYKGKKVCVDEKGDGCAAAFLGDIFVNYEKVEGGRSRELNFTREGESSSYSMASPIHQRMSSLLIGPSSSFQDGDNNNINSDQEMQWNTLARTSNLIDNFINNASTTARDATPSRSSQVRSQVWPTRVISGPEPKPLLEIINTSDRRLAELCFLGQPRSPVENPLPHYNLLGSSHQLKPEEEPMIVFNLHGQSPMSQVKPSDQIMTDYSCTLPGQSLMSQQKPIRNNFSWQSFMPQLKPEKPMTCYNLLGESLLSPQNPSETMTGYNLSGQSFSAQENPRDSMSGFNLSGQSFLSQQKPEDGEPMAGYDISHAGIWTEQDTSTFYNSGNTYQPVEFEATLGSTNFNNISFPEQASLYTPPPAMYGYLNDLPTQLEPSQLNPLGLFPSQMPMPSSSFAAIEMPMGLGAMNYFEGNATGGQQGGAAEGTSTTQLLWVNDQPNLALQL